MKPELLMPVGNIEAFYAAIEGGADAVYLGLRQFSARNRAKNFTLEQLHSICAIAKKNNVAVYVTINTLIKNNEFQRLLNTIFALTQINISAIIIQDWGLYYILTKFFPKLIIHASTQLGNHNSLGANFSKKQNLERIILSRELTINELKLISAKSDVQLEIFVHGALCYSFSGYCLFSSYLGGMSANRGQCRQPCRRNYNFGNSDKYVFNLKDLQLIDYIPQFSKMGTTSLKIEGRMKSAEYVYQTARAYRMVIDDFSRIEEAKKILNFDFGREKTSYFMGGKVTESISVNPYTGIAIGTVDKINDDELCFKTKEELLFNDRIRILPQSGKDSKALKIKEMKTESKSVIEKCFANENVIISINKDFSAGISKGDKIFLTGKGEFKFKRKLLPSTKKIRKRIPEKLERKIYAELKNSNKKNRDELFLRIDTIDWMRKINIKTVHKIIFNLPIKDYEKLDLSRPFMKENISKFIIELPKFISEEKLIKFKKLLKFLYQRGISNFMVSHISQTELLKSFKKINIFANENVYTLNDFSIKFLQSQNINNFVYPLEDDFENLFAGKIKTGIVPLYFYPQLFFSRMPIEDFNEQMIKDKTNNYRKVIRDGFTIILPEYPVSILQYKEKLLKKSFNRFLIDLSFVQPSKHLFKKIIEHFYNSTAVQPSTTFNFKKGLF